MAADHTTGEAEVLGAFLLSLPETVLHAILATLDPKDLLSTMQACSFLLNAGLPHIHTLYSPSGDMPARAWQRFHAATKLVIKVNASDGLTAESANKALLATICNLPTRLTHLSIDIQGPGRGLPTPSFILIGALHTSLRNNILQHLTFHSADLDATGGACLIEHHPAIESASISALRISNSASPSNIKHLTVGVLQLDSGCQPGCLVQMMPQLQSLHIHSIDSDSLRALARALQGHPQLRNLAISSTKLGYHELAMLLQAGMPQLAELRSAVQPSPSVV